ncbi:hypothetical protein CHY_0261 [Carboxydothermus hydrogenoformans Z-2901]|uniref:Uncharacterized protein n=1 Tax=Carboxydothermus hydrogenoformans (strain ATCC BAA-161 / DSM 6008 / Z-2901) TaxID=246194 RepID=Q3AFF1_CARHZ|nr:hypothetical protein CHY_0261 [Carboxydothermus hydrogenoformans Z-2901]
MPTIIPFSPVTKLFSLFYHLNFQDLNKIYMNVSKILYF